MQQIPDEQFYTIYKVKMEELLNGIYQYNIPQSKLTEVINMYNDKNTFDKALLSTKIDGIDTLLMWLSTTDFYEAPASTKYHLSKPGGLLEHSLNVCYNLKRVCKEFSNVEYSREDIIICGLLHDVCKADVYKKDYKNYKERDLENTTFEEWEVKHDSIGDFVWREKEIYTFDDSFPYGHGEKSVYLINRFINLTNEQAMAIRYHMGAFNASEANNASKAFEKYPLALYLHIADMLSTYVTEKE